MINSLKCFLFGHTWDFTRFMNHYRGTPEDIYRIQFWCDCCKRFLDANKR